MNEQPKVFFFSPAPIEGNLKFLTDPEMGLQVGIHEPKEARSSKLHLHRIYSEFFYVERGAIAIEFTDETGKLTEIKVLNQGESLLMMPGIGHRVHFPANCRVLEVHQGPYVDDKIQL